MFEDNDFFEFDSDVISSASTKEGPNKPAPENKSLNGTSKDILIKKRKLDTSDSILLQSPCRLKEPTLSPGFVKRRFPGPAGLLPDISKRNTTLPRATSHQESSGQDEDLLLCSQQTYSLYEEGGWRHMTADFRSFKNEQLYEKFNINWIKINSSKNKILVNHKAPFLAAVLDSIDIINGKIPTINVILKDKTGTINGTVLYSLYEEYSDFFTTNSVLVLKQFGVLALQNNHCITITPNNLVNIYHLEKANKSECKEECIKKIVVQPCNVEEIWENYSKALASFEKSNSNRVLTENSEKCNSKFMQLPKLKVLNNCTKSNIFSFKKNNSVSSNTSFFRDIKTPTNVDVETSLQNKCTSDLGQSEKDKNAYSGSQVSVKVDKEEHTEIWKKLFEDVDPSTFLDDF